jgi:hypothetical protein
LLDFAAPTITIKVTSLWIAYQPEGLVVILFLTNLLSVNSYQATNLLLAERECLNWTSAGLFPGMLPDILECRMRDTVCHLKCIVGSEILISSLGIRMPSVAHLSACSCKVKPCVATMYPRCRFVGRSSSAVPAFIGRSPLTATAPSLPVAVTCGRGETCPVRRFFFREGWNGILVGNQPISRDTEEVCIYTVLSGCLVCPVKV